MADTNRHLSYHQLEAIIMGRLDRSAHPEIDEHLKVISELHNRYDDISGR